MEERIQEYLDTLFPKKRLSITEKELSYEIKTHIWELYDSYMELGDSEDIAMKKAIQDMGEPQLLRKQIKKEKISYKTIALWIITVLVIISSVYINSWGIAIDGSHIVNNILFISIGISVIIVTSKVNFGFWKKYAFYFICFSIMCDLIATFILLNRYGIVLGNHKLMFVYIYIIGIGYLTSRYEDLGKRKKYVKYIISIIILLTAKASAKITLFILLVSFFAIFLKIKNKGVQKSFLQGLGICLSIFGAKVMSIVLFGAEYEVERLKALLSLQKGSVLEKNQDIAAQILADVNVFERIELFDLNMNMMQTNQAVYIVSYIAGAFGLCALFLILILFCFQIGIIGSKVVEYRDEEIIGMSILSTYVARILYAIAVCMNFAPISSITLPFMNCDVWIFMFDCLCMGYFMNRFIYRRRYG